MYNYYEIEEEFVERRKTKQRLDSKQKEELEIYHGNESLILSLVLNLDLYSAAWLWELILSS